MRNCPACYFNDNFNGICGFKPPKQRLGYIRAMKSHHPILTWHGIHQILHPKALPRSLGRRRAGRNSENTAPSSFCIHSCPYPGRLAYMHGLPLIIVGKRHHSMRYGRPLRDGRRGWVGTGLESGRAEIATAKRYVR